MKKLLLISMLLFLFWCGEKNIQSEPEKNEQSINQETPDILVPVDEVAAPQEFSTSVSEWEAPSLFQ
jgi:hypothetical protein